MIDPQKQFREIADPGNGMEYRPAPFWCWNDELTPEQLRQQIREMRGAGLGGYFMHSRIGLATPYLGEQWMACIHACIEEGRRLGMKSWLYDEDGFPSGFAGGLVAGRGGEYARKTLRCRARSIQGFEGIYPPLPGCVKQFLGYRVGKTLRQLEDVTGEAIIASSHAGKTVFEFYVEQGDQYVDTLNPKVVAAFLECTYDVYFKRFAAAMGAGRDIPGIFTDEPQYAWHAIPWTEALPTHFRRRRGYDLLPRLASLFFDVGEYQQTRHDFYRTVTELFVGNFTRRLFDWCDARGLSLTGHQNENEGEDDLAWQIGSCGAVMPHYEYMHIPGIDHLNCNGEVYAKDSAATTMRHYSIPLAKQVSSVAHQLGGRRVLCELFANFGQGMTFEDQRWIVNWMFVLGVDLLCPHLLLYSLRGFRKRDCPPTLSHHQPWWRYYALLNNLFARTSFMLTRGTHVADILVLHPITSAWCVYHPDDQERVMELNHGFIRLSESLLQVQRDFDYGDELLLRRHGSVDGAQIGVGHCRYRIVVLPPLRSMLRETYALLRQFHDNGGKIIAVQQVPDRIEGSHSEELEAFLEAAATVVPNDRQALREVLAASSASNLELDGDSDEISGVFSQERRWQEKRIFFLVNTHRERRVQCTVRIRGEGQLQRWDGSDGNIVPVVCRNDGERIVTEVSFEPAGSRILVLDSARQPRLGAPVRERVAATITVQPPWQLERHSPNVLVLDYCDYRLDGEAWQEHRPVLRELSRPPYGDPAPALSRMLTRHGAGHRLKVRYHFTTADRAAADAVRLLAMETAAESTVTLNGAVLGESDDRFWLDPSFRSFSVAGLVRAGNNVIEATTTLHPLTEIEQCYILGEFDVVRRGHREFVIGTAREVVAGTNLAEEGSPFFCGAVTVSTEVELPAARDLSAGRVYLELACENVAVVEVHLNAECCGIVFPSERRVEVTEQLRKGNNTLSLKLVGTLRNLLGPHHFTGAESRSAIALLSLPREDEWTDAYRIVPFGVKHAAFRYVRSD